MPFEEEILRPDSNVFVCLEIEAETENFRFSNRPLEEPGLVWEALIRNQPLIISHEMDPETQQISLSSVQITMENRIEDDGVSYFAKLLDSGVELENRIARILLKFERDGQWFCQNLFTGICNPETLTNSTFTLTVSPFLDSKLGILQRQANDIDFPQIPKESIGQGLNLILGECTNGNTGTVKLLPVTEDLGSSSTKLLVAQHPIAELTGLFRLRNNIYSPLLSGFSLNINDEDEKGHDISTVEITSGHQQGDLYFADVKGIPGAGYLDLNGSTFLSKNSDQLQLFNFGSKPFTIEISLVPQRQNTEEALISHCGDAGQRGWKLSKTSDDKISLELSTDGSAIFRATGDTCLNYNNDPVIIRAAVNPGAEVELNVAGIIQNLTTEGNLGTEIYFPTAAFNIASFNSGQSHFQGKINYVVIAEGFQTGNNYRVDPLQDIISEWQFSHNCKDLQKRNHLEVCGTAAFTCLSHQLNPAFTLRSILLLYEGITSMDIDENSIVAAATVCSELGLDGDGVHGGIIPRSGGRVENNSDRSEILQELARNFGHTLVPLASGKIALKRLIEDVESQEAMVHYSSADGDFQDAFISVSLNPLKRANEVRALLKHSHATEGNHEGYLRGYNQLSQEIYGKAEQQWNYSFQRKVEALETVLGPRIIQRSGRSRSLSFTVPGYKGLQQGSQVGDVVKVTAPAAFGDFTARKIIITSKAVDLINGGVQIKGLTMDNQLGVVAFSSEETLVIPASETTFIGATETPCGSNSFPLADANSSYGNLDFLLHGHHYAYSGVCQNSQYGFGNINWLTFFCWSFDTSQWLNSTVKKVSVNLNVECYPELRFEDEAELLTRSGWNGTTLHVANRDIDNLNKSYNNMINYLSSDISSIIGTCVGTMGIGMGSLSIPLNNDGIEKFSLATRGLNYGTSKAILVFNNSNSGDFTSVAKISSYKSGASVKPSIAISFTK